MPEMHFYVEWPDGQQDSCYSPSLVVQQHLKEGVTYPLQDFLERSRTALLMADERVLAKYGQHCSLALGQLHRIEQRVAQYADFPEPQVRVIKFLV